MMRSVNKISDYFGFMNTYGCYIENNISDKVVSSFLYKLKHTNFGDDATNAVSYTLQIIARKGKK